MLSYSDWVERAGMIRPEVRALIHGRLTGSVSGETFDSVCPSNGKVLAAVACCGQEDVDLAVRSCRRAFDDKTWRNQSPRERKKTLLRLSELILKNAEDFALLETLDMGKPISESLLSDIPLSAECVAWFAEAVDKIYGEVGPTGADALATITREPVGVVGAVIPWNFPLLMAVWKVAPALAMGNSVLVKPAEQSPLSAIRLGELALEAGLPEGVLNIVPGLGEGAGRAIGLHRDIDCVSFTGSAEVGKLFLKYSGESNMKRVSLECGGKSAQIVTAECFNLDEAAEAVASGIWYNQGEVCSAGSRLLVEKSIQKQLLEKVMALAPLYFPSDPLNPSTRAGAMVDENQMDKVLSYIEWGKKEGAELILGGNRVLTETGGFFVEPTLFDGVNNRMKIAREEIFGPVLSCISFEDVEEAVAIANDSEYGLVASVWSREISTAMRIAGELRSGTVYVNCFDRTEVTLPFGGYRESGFGRDNSLHALDKYSELKTTLVQIGK